jgi:hypothetical protein
MAMPPHRVSEVEKHLVTPATVATPRLHRQVRPLGNPWPGSVMPVLEPVRVNLFETVSSSI